MRISDSFEYSNRTFLFSDTKKVIAPVFDQYHGKYINPTKKDVLSFKYELESVLEKHFEHIVKDNPSKDINLDFDNEFSISVYLTVYNDASEGEEDSARFVYTSTYVSIELNVRIEIIEKMLTGSINYNNAINFIATMFGHEAIHYFQIKDRQLVQEFDQKLGMFSQERSRIKSDDVYQAYLGTPIELGAYAAQAANELVAGADPDPGLHLLVLIDRHHHDGQMGAV